MIKSFENILEDLYNKYVGEVEIEIGVFEENNERDPDAPDSTTGKSPSKKDDSGPTNAMLMQWHENGLPEHDLPERPVLQYSIEQSKDAVDNCKKNILKGLTYNNWKDKEVMDEIERLGIRIANKARDIIDINDGTLQANAESTIKQKGYNHPLMQTSQLSKAITYKIIKK